MVTQTDGRQEWNCFPGGQLEPGETIDECLSRELMEELSLPVIVGNVLAVGTYIEGETTSLELFVRCEAPTSTPIANEPHIINPRFIPVAQIPTADVYPLEVARDLAELLSDGVEGAKRYQRLI